MEKEIEGTPTSSTEGRYDVIRSVTTTGYDIGLIQPKDPIERLPGRCVMIAYSRYTDERVFFQWVRLDAVRNASPEKLAKLVRYFRRTGMLKEYALYTG